MTDGRGLHLLRWLTLGLASTVVVGCNSQSVTQPVETPTPLVEEALETVGASPTPEAEIPGVLQTSWQAYKARFIQPDGRVIDSEGDARATASGQAYAMLRAVLMDDPDTFERTLAWAEENLRRSEEQTSDALWAARWQPEPGDTQEPDATATPLEPSLAAEFASEAEVDAIAALILASRQWGRPRYQTLARAKLAELWERATVDVNGMRYLLPGSTTAFRPQSTLLLLQPASLSPSAFRLFAQVDSAHDWMSLVTSSYLVLENSPALSVVGLPSDWVLLDTASNEFQPVANKAERQTVYGADAYRVWWRVALDAVWFNERRATRYLRNQLWYLSEQWRSQQVIPARIDRQGEPIDNEEAIAQYAMLYAAFQVIEPAIAKQLYQQKLLPAYRGGVWDEGSPNASSPAGASPNAAQPGNTPAPAAQAGVTSMNSRINTSQTLIWLGIYAPLPPAASLVQPHTATVQNSDDPPAVESSPQSE